MNRLLKIALSLAFAVTLATTALAQYSPSQWRLTLQSNTPVMTSDVVNTNTIYYTPYLGTAWAWGSGTTETYYTLSGGQFYLYLTGTNNPQGHIYDIFLIDSSNNGDGGSGWGLCTGPAWASLTSRGSGSGSTAIQLTNQGLWMNANGGWSCYNDGYNYGTSTSANTVLYVGSVYTTAAGETSVQFTPIAGAGGSGTIIGLWNAYNRVRVTASSTDSNSSWTYSTSSWRDADGSASNSITWLDGLGQTSISAAYDSTGSNSSATGQVNIGIGINDINTPAINAQVQSTTAILTMHSATISSPILGLNVANALERVSSGTETFYGESQSLLTLGTEY
jgi:hypothetical protein